MMHAAIEISFRQSASRRYREALALAERFPEFQAGNPHTIVLSPESYGNQVGKLRRLWQIIGPWKSSSIQLKVDPGHDFRFEDLENLLSLDWDILLSEPEDPEPITLGGGGPAAGPAEPNSPTPETASTTRQVPDTTYADIGGINSVLQTVREVVELPIRHPEIFDHLRLKPHRGVLLQGPPGCGKTLLAKAIAHEVDAHFVSIRGPELLSKYQGESEENLRAVFEEARQFAPSIIFFDEIDAIAQARSGQENLRHEARFVNQFLTLIDGFDDLRDVTLLASTNRAELLDPALLRSGRFDYQLDIPLPDAAGCAQIFRIHAKGKPIAKGFKRAAFCKRLVGRSGADIAFIVREAAYNCLRRSVDLAALVGCDTPLNGELDGMRIDLQDFDAALKRLDATSSVAT